MTQTRNSTTDKEREPEVEVSGKIVSSFNEADNEITYRKC